MMLPLSRNLMTRRARAAVRAFSSAAAPPTSHAVLHSSRIPTTHFQDSLPKLPVPKLEDTMQRMLYSMEPLTTAEEFAEAKKLAADFAAGEGIALQEALIARDKAKYSSFITEPWFDMYLKDQRPLLLNHNPQLTFKDEEGARCGPGTQTARAARLLHAAATFMRTLESHSLEPDVFHTNPARSKTSLFEEVVRWLPRGISFYGAAACGAYPLDMSQYANLFRSTRIPGKVADHLKVAPTGSTGHVICLRNGRFFKVELLDSTGGTLPLSELHGALDAVCADADASPAPADESVALLTSLPRDQWAALRSRIEEVNPSNVASLEAIDSALFVLSLEATSPPSVEESTAFFLHGSGMDRWFDKSISLIVSSHGSAAVNFEHAWGDGVAVLRFFNEIFDASCALPATAAETPRIAPSAQPFELPADVKAGIRDAKKAFDTTVSRTDLAHLRKEDFNSAMLKKAKLSPDGAMQMAFQLAHVKMHGGPILPSTYESASTAAFKHGRTETIRSATPEAALFTAAFTDPSTSATERTGALRAAVDNHSRITRECLMGKGMDRHLFALADLASGNGGSLPALFQCAAMLKLKKIILSTSTLNSEALMSGGFGPVNDDCYALGYGIRSYGCEARVMTYGKDSQGFADCLGKAMDEMREAAQASTA